MEESWFTNKHMSMIKKTLKCSSNNTIHRSQGGHAELSNSQAMMQCWKWQHGNNKTKNFTISFTNTHSYKKKGKLKLNIATSTHECLVQTTWKIKHNIQTHVYELDGLGKVSEVNMNCS